MKGPWLERIRQLFKDGIVLVIKRCLPSRWQQAIRQVYLVRSVDSDRGRREPELLALPQLIRAGNVVADVGANIGVYTVALSRLVGSQGMVLAFEPVPETMAILSKVIETHHLENVRTFLHAVTASYGKQPMVIPNMEGFTGYYRAHLAKPGSSGIIREVETITLDGLWKTGIFTRLDFIKCDVEGSELDVIRGAQELIREQCPGWLIEVSRPTSGEVFRLFEQHGYLACVYHDGHFRRVQHYQDNQFSNYFFFHPNTGMWEAARLLLV